MVKIVKKSITASGEKNDFVFAKLSKMISKLFWREILKEKITRVILF